MFIFQYCLTTSEYVNICHLFKAGSASDEIYYSLKYEKYICGLNENNKFSYESGKSIGKLLTAGQNNPLPEKLSN
jgi:hypothetical protein